MTAIPPMENRRVKGVQTGIYSANKTCAHPDCAEAVPDRGHHIFPRSAISNGLYFVQAYDDDGKEVFPHPIPHVTGLCRPHHDAVELHDAWIRLEGDGEFVWYDRDGEDWERVGALDPQPGGRNKSKKPRRKYQGEQRRQRKTISVKVPQDAQEDGGAIWDELMEQARAVLEAPDKPAYYVLTAALYVFVRDEGGRA